jgi:hypothetical protein
MDMNQQENLNSILANIDWHHAFIRELHLVSPSYYDAEKEFTVAPDCKPDAFVLIFTGDLSCSHIELVFHEVEKLNIPCDMDICPTCIVKKDCVMVKFIPACINGTVARSLTITRLGDEGAGWNLRYGQVGPFNKSGYRI